MTKHLTGENTTTIIINPKWPKHMKKNEQADDFGKQSEYGSISLKILYVCV